MGLVQGVLRGCLSSVTATNDRAHLHVDTSRIQGVAQQLTLVMRFTSGLGRHELLGTANHPEKRPGWDSRPALCLCPVSIGAPIKRDCAESPRGSTRAVRQAMGIALQEVRQTVHFMTARTRTSWLEGPNLIQLSYACRSSQQ